eukprot:SAG11_NODE_2606_length_3176_cov_2.057524_1_plen_64_part_10
MPGVGGLVAVGGAGGGAHARCPLTRKAAPENFRPSAARFSSTRSPTVHRSPNRRASADATTSAR